MTGGLDLPRVTTVQATMKAGRHAWRVAWLPFEGWWCTPEPLTRACPDQRRCEHITAVQATVTPPEDQ
jgi:hypothetical protein